MRHTRSVWHTNTTTTTTYRHIGQKKYVEVLMAVCNAVQLTTLFHTGCLGNVFLVVIHIKSDVVQQW